MPDNFPILSLIAFSPLIGVLILMFMPKTQGGWIKTTAIVVTLIPLLLSGWLYSQFNTSLEGVQFKEELPWIQVPLNKETQGLSQLTSFFFEFNYTMAVDGLSLPLVFLTALVATMAALASVYIKKRWKSYFILFLLLETGMLGVFMSQDLFLFFVFFEMTLIPMFFLVGIWGFKDRERAANKFLIYNGIGSAIMLIAFLILVSTAGFSQTVQDNGVSIHYSGNLNVIMENLFQNPDSYVNQGDLEGNPFFLSETMKWSLFLMLLVAFGIKLPIFPFHTWMLKVHMEAPPAVVMIHSGILLKMGAYGLIRFGILLFPQQAMEWASVLAVLGVINILYGAILAFVQREFRLVLAYSSISHMGIVLLGIAAFNTIGLQGAVFQLVSHGLISALMFLIVGSIYERTRTTRLDELGGLAKSVPFISGILLVAGMASLGLPGLSGFISEFLAFMGLFETQKIMTAVGALGIILTAVYVLRGVLAITYGPLRKELPEMRDARLIEAIPMITLVAFIVVLGIYPSVLSDPLHQTVSGFNQFIHSVAKMGG
ncbi:MULTISPECIES: NADH-quinone oxidoreductase subunit M [unclassified Paenibacillus]|uniref:complex I subunit 4 family protein n=1 Tax=unclassified Paenibacillus TaxID=185978 RepID=UPI001AE8AEC4|nr:MULTISPECIES: NADH-quinone oxidoreductase subunit M [unclassified Paenibacillus]MBP1157839.1 NADH-quinone oxidoreductase subunit M [Paenibacillus sp. PvP091]MBP1171425.1 NADH-quinone oxidoreductase subunit M [Paenibacillus sp. PvR098]MBP2442453.1 NADH-quinone oxidoreductase subunit M [Paenibacillus sp. PvP052]